MDKDPKERFDYGGLDEEGELKPLADFNDNGIHTPHNNFRVAHGSAREIDHTFGEVTDIEEQRETHEASADALALQEAMEERDREAELDDLADKLGSYDLARRRLGMEATERAAPSVVAFSPKAGRRASRRGGRSYPEISGRDISRMIDEAVATETKRLGRPLTDDETARVAHLAEQQARQQNG